MLLQPALIAQLLFTSAVAQGLHPGPLDQTPTELPGLHNVVAFHDGYYSGSAPEGHSGFASLVQLGVKTLISVDGAEPDAAQARALGIRYIHLPIGYNGFDEGRKLELVRATRDAMRLGAVYVHCHHGKHRSAGAAGTVAVSLGWATPAQMMERLRVSGTAPQYKGLYACVATAVPLSSDVIDAVAAEFPEIAKPANFVRAMVELDEALDHLRQIDLAGWVAPPHHPDLVPAAEAGRAADLLRGLIDSRETRERPADFAAKMEQCRSLASSLEASLLTGKYAGDQKSGQLQALTDSCTACHEAYRDRSGR